MPRKDVAEKLRRRAMGFMDAAKERLKVGDYDLTCFMAEQAVQLYLKSVILELSGEVPRTHSIRQLLSILSKLLDEQFDFDRKQLVFLEDAYIKARYLGAGYEREDAEEAIKIAEEVISAVSRVMEGKD
ncbi:MULTISPECIES: HEPN domain-containing protein [Archaeoglobus]|jgi:HEPN domain-containing protein|uniref:HEPN domain-containing protein n=3 Tax=Archaeoglobus fulgidus TaxID=2234 RepID=O29662_ARCFU|nr:MULTISPECIES: HEPN domain-containing protein [Archaeoglobus]AAB90648.1 conserved hypothetical protein [Archaeoglobus fulgidus DSM 4304]AIG97469.1 hypothetical protein AFULGI_00006680 [Archaeoglobus fulgidus DSM 8774]KUJ93100.1 MAG: hypothetical protein XD40_1728 [Archaeoglobus fulgidus]KUK06839.1 MAG: hypothetical protein XD48_0949 [Archaeoglobus fulgidus]MDI3498650.1 hypothetical protein [Archaeoglobus sp.]